MSNYLIQDSTLTDIADAIREKTGSQATIDVADFATEISNIPSGGSAEEPIKWVYTASGSADTYTYTATEAGLYLAVAVRHQNTGCSISLPDGGTVVLESGINSSRCQMKVVQVEANQRIQLGIYNSTHNRGGWIFKLNVTPSAIAYSRAVDQSGNVTIVNQGTSADVLSVIVTTGTNSTFLWDETMKCYITSPLTAIAQVRIMRGVDSTMPTVTVSGGISGQWILSLASN